MPYYRECPHCGDNIDFGERCDCRKEKAPGEAATSAESEKNNIYGHIN